jgi:uncharacterized membrane protein
MKINGKPIICHQIALINNMLYELLLEKLMRASVLTRSTAKQEKKSTNFLIKTKFPLIPSTGRFFYEAP